MSAATIISEAYGEGACLYESVLEVPRDASPSQLRKAYYKKCLSYHPDKLPSDLPENEREIANSRFRAISVAYAILSDEGRRREYDEAGDLYDDDDELTTSKAGVDSWREYFDAIFPKVTEADIDAFEVKYKCSDEEEGDVLRYYSRFGGDLNKMLECVMLSSDVDKARWVEDYIRPAIERGEVDDHMDRIEKTLGGKDVAGGGGSRGGGRKTKAGGGGGGRGSEKTRADERADEGEGGDDDESDTPVARVVVGGRTKGRGSAPSSAADSSSKEGKSSSSKKGRATTTTIRSEKKKSSSSSSSDDLVARIRGNASARRREEGFNSLLAGLEERYGGEGGGKKKKKGGGGASDNTKRQRRQQDGKEVDGDIMDDDEFAKIQAKIMKNKGSR
ncbi:hypothetical protein ACHAW5_003638 [Stephanodiscus triporus]|uniref:J domain-containing protein n=1 Tax=Stephanodiscus triporus TaxID=2934178 RepID=A0ABD3NUF9_9STRA